MTASRTVLAAVDGAIAIEVLRELHRVCLAMDAEQIPCGDVSDDEYQAAMALRRRSAAAPPHH